ncbi:MAG: hypothetical protein LLG15_00305 [Betaproteobacteria bacterium]|nr:hypothetical protein [Betaproteobacteria bacterium]
MNTLKKIEKRLLKNPDEPASLIFKELIRALHQGESFNLKAIYDLDYNDFELALAVLKDWRLDRFTKTKERLKEHLDARAS